MEKCKIVRIRFSRDDLILYLIDDKGEQRVLKIRQEMYQGGPRSVARLDKEVVWYSQIIKKF